MMERKLTDQQIEQLFAFTKKKMVHYYDLQVELVDHLATSIEEEMDANNQLSFELALQKVYNRFGIFGFAKVVQEREVALWKQSRNIWLNAIKEFFTIPKIFLSLLIFIASYQLGNYLSPEARGWTILGLWLTFMLYEIYMMRKGQKREKKLMLTQYSWPFSFSGFIFPYYIFIIDRVYIHRSFTFAIFVLIVFIVEMAIIEVNQQVRKKAMELYPEAFVTGV